MTITVGQPFYNQVNGPLMLALVFLMGVGPLLPWRRASWRTLGRTLVVPVAGGLAVAVVLAALGVSKPYALAAFSLCAVVAVGILSEWVRGTLLRHRHGDNYVLGFARLIAANRPRYGGYVVHLAVVFLALGIVGSTFYSVQRDVILVPGERVVVGDYELEYLGTDATDKGDRTEFVSRVNAYKDGSSLGTMVPTRTFYPRLPDGRDPGGHPLHTRRGPVHSPPARPWKTVAPGSRILVNPLVWWMWVAGPVFMLGTLIALWPQRKRVVSPAMGSTAPPGEGLSRARHSRAGGQRLRSSGAEGLRLPSPAGP